MKVRLAYGHNGLIVELPDDCTTVIEPTYVPGLPDQEGAILTAIRNPIGSVSLRQLVQHNQTVAISVCDITRPMPSKTVLPVLLGELRHVPSENIKILIATGTHRFNTADELEQMLGAEVTDNYAVINHNTFDNANLKHIGETSKGIPIYLNRHWVDSDVRITTGFVEPHFFAGFSGGPKMVAPGLAGFKTIMPLHNADMIAHPNARWGITDGNPIHDAIREIARISQVDFSLDVTINRNQKITSVYAGNLFDVHKAACAVAKRSAMQAVERPFEVVLTTNSGYPLDQNLYQAVKGMSAAAQVVKQGGTIVCAAECSDGVPSSGEYRDILSSAANPKELLDVIRAPDYNRHDQWQVQVQAQIQLNAEVLVKSGSNLSDEQVIAAHLEPVEDVEYAISKALGRFGSSARLCVIPEGPQTIPYIRQTFN